MQKRSFSLETKVVRNSAFDFKLTSTNVSAFTRNVFFAKKRKEI